MSDMKLDYEVVTKPSQALVGQTATLMIFISNLTDDPVAVSAIVVNVSVGTTRSALTESLDGKPPLPIKRFKVEQDDASYIIQPPDQIPGQPPSGPVVLAPNDEIQLVVKEIEISPLSGTAELTIYEVIQTEGKPSTTSKNEFIVKVVPDVKATFSVDPVDFHPGEDVSLDWLGTKGATYVISYPPNNVIRTIKGQSTPLKEKGPYTISNLAETTTFTLTVTGGPKPVIKQKTASLVRAHIVKFISNTTDPFFDEEVTLEWVVEAEHYEIEHDHKILKKGSGPGGKLSGSLKVTPDGPISAYTLTVWSGTGAGKTTDKWTVTLEVPKPKVSIIVEPSFKFDEKPIILWGIKNRWKHNLKARVVGARTGHVYYSEYLTAGDGHDLEWPTYTIEAYDKFGKAYLDVKLGVGEDLILTAETAWFKDEDPIKVQKTIKFDGIQALKWDHGSVEEASIGDAIADAYFEQIENVNWPSERARLIRIAGFAAEWGVAYEKMFDPVRWQLFVSIKAENARSIMVRVNTPKEDTDWKRLWSRDDPRATFGDKNWYPVSQDVEGPVSWEGHLYLFAPKSMVKEALMALTFIVGSKEMHISWHSTGKRIELKLS